MKFSKLASVQRHDLGSASWPSLSFSPGPTAFAATTLQEAPSACGEGFDPAHWSAVQHNAIDHVQLLTDIRSWPTRALAIALLVEPCVGTLAVAGEISSARSQSRCISGFCASGAASCSMPHSAALHSRGHGTRPAVGSWSYHGSRSAAWLQVQQQTECSHSGL